MAGLRVGAETPTLVAVTVSLTAERGYQSDESSDEEKFADVTAVMGAVGFLTQLEEPLLSSISPLAHCVLSRNCHRTR